MTERPPASGRTDVTPQAAPLADGAVQLMQAIPSGKRRFGAHIVVSGVSHRYRRAANLALKDISFEVQPGEAVALVGRSGCGKSTMLHILSGLMTPSAGEVHIDGALVWAPSPRWIVMFQQPHLYPWMTVRQNVGLGLKFARRPRREITTRVDELLKLVELEGYAARNVQDLSGGQQQRVALARSLAVRPDLLLLDEPFSALDAVTRRALQRDVRHIALEIGITVVIVTHDIPEAVAMADRAIVMQSDPGAIAEILPIKVDRQDRDNRGADAQAVQQSLQAAFERACGRTIELPPHSNQDTLKIVAAGRR
jgi:ABC-type nitrate/sulfonate/bicarbonate transport system ATPase subunit